MVEESSASSWGCELKFWWKIKMSYQQAVSLFVRLWVEISFNKCNELLWSCQPLREAVSWNTTAGFKGSDEYRQPLREAVSWNIFTMMMLFRKNCQPLREAVSWNSDLFTALCYPACQPLREAVSWNAFSGFPVFERSKSASSWGCELKYGIWRVPVQHRSQPLREAVSWNI